MKIFLALIAVTFAIFSSKGVAKNDSSLIQELADIKIKEAEHYLYKKDYERALVLYKEVSALNKNDLEVLYRIGVCYYKQKNETEAENYFEQASVDSKIRAKIQMFKRMNNSDPNSDWW